LSRALAQAHSVDLSSALARWQREDLERKEARAVEEGKRAQIDPVVLAEREIVKIEANGSFGWWRLNMFLLAQSNGRLDPSSEFRSDLTKSRGWLSLSGESRNSVVLSARRYLEENFVRSRPWMGTNTLNRPAAAGYRAFRLLMSE
jgi:hypothetical protein